MKLYQYLIEDKKLNNAIANGIYREIFTKATHCMEGNHFECHCSVYWVKSNLTDN